MATWNIKTNRKITTIEISDSATPSQVADLLAERGLVNKSEMLGQIHLLPESDGSLTLVDDSGFPYAELRRAQEQTIGDIASVAAQAAANIPRCPVCNSSNLVKQGVANRAVSSFVFGGVSPEARAQWICKNCNHMF